jgi:hypothetical protein
MAIPTAVETVNRNSNNVVYGKWYAQKKTGKKNWLAIKIDRSTNPISSTQGTKIYRVTYTSILYSDGTNGAALNTGTVLGADEVSVASNLTGQALKDAISAGAKKMPTYKKALAALEDAATTPADQDNTADSDLDNTPIPNVELDQVRWNPPPHFITRSPSFYNLANIGGDRVSSAKVLSTYGNSISYKLGKVYQNKSSAAALNNKDNVDPNKVKANDLWGFRFLYNPKEISYGSAIDTSIDWMLQPKDPSNFFGGNTIITFTLYLNRIADMKALRSSGNVANNYPGGALSAEQKNGILKRGTEFDLEYLYRVVNGAPGKTTLVTDSTLLTSDYGYITGMPVWIQIHDNMRYRGSLSSIEVSHVIFTESMIPTLSVVKLSFIRYPELDRLGTNKDAVVNKIKTTEK